VLNSKITASSLDWYPRTAGSLVRERALMFLLVKLVPVVAFLNLFAVIALLAYYTTLIGGWLVRLVTFQDRLSIPSSRIKPGTDGCIVI